MIKPDVTYGLKELVCAVSEELDRELRTDTLENILTKVKAATPSTEKTLGADFKKYCNYLKKEQGEVDLNLAYKTWSMKWMATQMSLISALLLLASTLLGTEK